MPEHSESQDSVPLSLLTTITGMLLHKYRDSEPISLKVLLQKACFLLSSSSPTHPTLCHLPILKIVQKKYKTWMFIISNIQCFLSYIASCELVLICPTVMGQSIRAFSNFHPLLWPFLLLGNWSMLCSQAYWLNQHNTCMSLRSDCSFSKSGKSPFPCLD